MRDKTITCPARQVETFEPGQVVEFDPEVCGPCQLRSKCTLSASGKGRTVSIAQDESTQKKLRARRQRNRAECNYASESASSIVLRTSPRDKDGVHATRE